MQWFFRQQSLRSSEVTGLRDWHYIGQRSRSVSRCLLNIPRLKVKLDAALQRVDEFCCFLVFTRYITMVKVSVSLICSLFAALLFNLVQWLVLSIEFMTT